MNQLQQIEANLTLYKRVKKAQIARKSFYAFSKYVSGYNGAPNTLIQPHAHGELCHLLQGTLRDIQDIGGERLEEGKGTCYDAFMRYQLPPTAPQLNNYNNSTTPVGSSALNFLQTNGEGSINHVNSLTIEGGEATVGMSDSLTLSLGDSIGRDSSRDPQSHHNSESGYVVPPFADIKKFLLELMPRGTFKSTIGTESFPLYAWLFNPNLRIHIASETLEKSLLYAGAVKNHLEANRVYRDIFQTIYDCLPDERRKEDKWTNSELNLAAKTALTREPNLSCGSPDVPKVGQHYDIIIVDDLMGPTNISDAGIEKAVNYYKGLLSVLEPGGILIVIGTRWHYRDVYGYIISNESRFQTLIKGAYREDGELFFPERLNAEFLAEQRVSQGNFFFNCQYMNRVVDDDTADFKRSLFRVEEVNLDEINIFMMIDPVPPGSDEKNDPDYFAICVGGLNKLGDPFYIDGWVGRPSPKEAIDKVFQLADQWKPKLIGFESQSFAKLYSFMLREEMRTRNKLLNIKEVKRTNKRETKAQRIRRLVPYYEARRVIHRKGANCVSLLEDQLLDFPRGSHDDLIDAFADLLEIGWKPTRIDPEEKKERREKLVRRYRNPITRV